MSETRFVSGWGGIRVPAEELFSEDLNRITAGAVLSRGLGRSYGDASLPAAPGARVANTVLADRILQFDPDSGRVRTEAGLALQDLNRFSLPRGWFTPVTPGTQYVTLGGMVAADVHGKNHHVDGCFGRHVTALRLRTASGDDVECSPHRDAELFWATVGGMGLTGHILEVEFGLHRVSSPWIWSESERYGDLSTLLAALADASRDWPFTVAWTDSLAAGRKLGRGVLICGRWATRDEAPAHAPPVKKRLAVPFTAPSVLMSRASIRLFNLAYYHSRPRRRQHTIQAPETFFYPLDFVRRWNRLYGRRGFIQYQCVLPRDVSGEAPRRFLQRFSELGGASFLTVVKDCGAESPALLSFPRPGVSIALDVPIRTTTQRLVGELNELVIAAGGRVYLAKDQMTSAQHFREMEPRLASWMAVKRRWDPEGRIRSAQAARLGLVDSGELP